MSSKFIRVKELQFVRDRGRTYTADGDRTITMRISQIVSITDEKYRNCSKYCIVSLTNGQIFQVTEETAEQIRLHLDIDTIYDREEA
tara:strand:+ start:581 stop:841 length:261 start_codon:yes stop_codon:yes gene_type:complete